jgi:hypothetical protein
MSDLAFIHTLAMRMRRALDALPKTRRPKLMANFPADCCGDSSLLLGAYFIDNQVWGFEWIPAERGSIAAGNWTSHVWLARGSLIVDITADQFADAPQAVVVSHSSPWHAGFASEPGQCADFRRWYGPGTDHLHEIYQRLHTVLFDAGAAHAEWATASCRGSAG